MNNSDSAKKGFKTFVLTLSISLIVFSAIYYVVVSYSPANKDVANSSQTEVAVNTVSDRVAEPVVQGAQDEKIETQPAVKGVSTTQEKAIFAAMAEKKPNAHAQEVLSGSTEVTETTESAGAVPATGYFEMTLGLVASLVLFVGALIYTSLNPRKIALADFEKKVLRK